MGPVLLYDLLNFYEENVKIFCLLRCDSIEHGRERICKHLMKTNLFSWKTSEEIENIVNNRIEILPGDLSMPYLDLENEIWENLVNSIGIM